MNSTQIKNQKPMIFKKPFTPPNHHHDHGDRYRCRYDHTVPCLPKEILQEIFNKVSLPIKTIFEFQSKKNSNVLSSIFSDSKFVESQANHYTLPCVLAYDGDHNKLFLFEGQKGNFVSMEINMDFIANHFSTKNMEILSSCNGMLLLSNRRFLWVVNPLTREIISLPKANGGNFCGDKSYYVMGFSPKSDKYKVVRVIGSLSQVVDGYYLEFSWYAEVLTLGTNTWRRINGCDHVLQNSTIEDEGVVMINGALYWLIHLGNKQEIVRFEIDSEEFELIPSPLDEVGLWYKCSLSSLGVVDDMLCVTRHERRSRRSCNNGVDLSYGMEMWVWKDCSVWKLWKIINRNVISGDDMRFVRKYDLIKVSEDDEEVLMMLQDPLNLVYYNTSRHMIREARMDGVDCMKIKGVVFCPNLRSIIQCIHVEEL